MVLLVAGLCEAIDIPRHPWPPAGNGTRLLTYNETTHGDFSPDFKSFSWISGEEDGQYVVQKDDGSLALQNIVTNSSKTLVTADKIPEDPHEHWVKPDLSAVLWSTNFTKQYRHSYFADYYIQDVDQGSLTPLVDDQHGDIQYARWSPVDNTIAYVRGNNLFMWKDGNITQVTKDGSPNIFNGVPDWVYEEEIFGSRYTLWFSPDGEYLAFLRFNETGVKTYSIQYYMDNQKIAPPYPSELDIRYPKVGTTNPTVQFRLLDLASYEVADVPVDAFPEDDVIIGEVAWATEGHDGVLYRAFNRVQDRSKVVLVSVACSSGTVVHERDGTDGWLDNNLAIVYVGALDGNDKAEKDKTYYVDLSDQSGWAHIYLFPVQGGEPIQLTSGEWEVATISKVDPERQLIYFTSTKHHSTERHLYSVSYQNHKMTPLVDDTVAAYWEASFSSGGMYYLLWYMGPDVPYQDLYSIDSDEPMRTITSNADLVHKLEEYSLPEISYFELEIPSGQSINVMQRLPANYDPQKKYPVLFTPYGGPGAQEVSKRWQSLGWNAYIASDPELEYITWTVDNRGTGFKGRAFRALVAKQLGRLEAEDQVFAASQLAKDAWVDSEHMGAYTTRIQDRNSTNNSGIWGWSYGGYLTAKVLETDSDVFSFGISTAPVSDWRFYDTMYTERYMKTLEGNHMGYNESAVRDQAGFHNIRGSYLIQHGTGDDNVHFQNSAVLTDTLMDAKVPPSKLQVQWFTDSTHGISFGKDSIFLYRQLSRQVWQEKNREFKELKHQWNRRHVQF